MRIVRAQFLPNHGLRKLLRSLVGEVHEGCGAGQTSSHRCGRLFSTAAAASDDAKSIQRSPRRVPKQERKIMVESFVNKYRTLNAGKFPSVSAAQREVGGSYYTIREILQELKYNFVHNPIDEIPRNSLVEREGAENQIVHEQEFSHGEELSCSHNRADIQTERHLVEVEKVPDVEEMACKSNMQVLGDKVGAEVKKIGDADIEREPVSVKEVYGQQPLSRDVGMNGDVSTDQKFTCEKAERNSVIEHSDHLPNDEIKKHYESREVLEVTSFSDDRLPSDESKKHFESRVVLKMTSFSEETLLDDTLHPKSKEDKDEFCTTSSSLQAEESSNMPRTGEPVLVNDEDAKSSQGFGKPNISTSKLTVDQKSPTYDGERVTSVESANDNDLQKKPSLWSNMKSFADSVFSIWRNR